MYLDAQTYWIIKLSTTKLGFNAKQTKTTSPTFGEYYSVFPLSCLSEMKRWSSKQILLYCSCILILKGILNLKENCRGRMTEIKKMTSRKPFRNMVLKIFFIICLYWFIYIILCIISYLGLLSICSCLAFLIGVQILSRKDRMTQLYFAGSWFIFTVG